MLAWSAGAQDTVYLSSPNNPQGRQKVSGRITDYNGQGLVLETAGGEKRYPAEQVALAILDAVARRSSVQLEEQTVERTGRAQRLQEGLFGPVVSVVRDLAHDAGKHEVDRHDLPIALACALHETGKGALATAQPEHGISRQQRALEQFEAHALSCERVHRHEIAANSYAHRAILPVDADDCPVKARSRFRRSPSGSIMTKAPMYPITAAPERKQRN